MNWICTADEQPKKGEWVLVWNIARNLAMMAKWTGRHWQAVGNNTKASDGTHWARVIGPDGSQCGAPHSAYGYTSRDSQS